MVAGLLSRCLFWFPCGHPYPWLGAADSTLPSFLPAVQAQLCQPCLALGLKFRGLALMEVLSLSAGIQGWMSISENDSCMAPLICSCAKGLNNFLVVLLLCIRIFFFFSKKSCHLLCVSRPPSWILSTSRALCNLILPVALGGREDYPILQMRNRSMRRRGDLRSFSLKRPVTCDFLARVWQGGRKNLKTV